uniref:Leucine-rich repeat-containing protein 49 n=1 Tax=Junco hyemalis TaxID=40217 RepID=A0A8C5NST1_JUNHY
MCKDIICICELLTFVYNIVLQFEFRINKEQSSFHNRLLQHDLEKNYSGRLDNTNFGSSSSISFPVLQRTAEEKILNSDRLTLERQKLTVCPIIDGEDHLRLLNFQHNFITRIQNISNLHHLVFLDLYDNQIEEISGVSTLRSLRVLLLGKNRIKKISNLENLKNLDVLDLHGNQIAKIENISHLSELRVLNLARNLLTVVENLNGLDSLTELNLRHNQVSAIKDVDTLPCLQRLFLSFNNISSFEDILCLADSSSLSDITLDGNPIAQETWYKHTVLHHMMQLRQLDMKRITILSKVFMRLGSFIHVWFQEDTRFGARLFPQDSLEKGALVQKFNDNSLCLRALFRNIEVP